MINAIFFLIELAATFVEIWMGLRMNAHVIKQGEKKIFRTLVATSIVVGMIVFINQYQLFSVWASLIAIAGIATASAIVYQIRISDALVVATAYIAILHITDFTSMAIWATVIQNPNFAIEIAKGYSVMRSLVIIFSKTTMVLVCLFIMYKIAPRANVLSRKIVGVVIAGAFLVWYFMNVTSEEMTAPNFIIWLMLLIVTVMGLYLATEYAKWRQEKAEYELAAAHNCSSAQIYEELSKNYDENRRLYHDLNNHYMSLQGYLKNEEYQRATEYLEGIHELNELTLTRWTGVPALDMLLNYKVSEGKRKEIRVEISSHQVTFELPDREITALFGNALDNAIEACEKVEEDKKWVKVVIRNVSAMTIIKITNPYKEIKTDKDGRLLTTKADSRHHGLGTRGMEQIVQRHNGTMQYKAEDGVFCLEIGLF